MMRSPGSRQLPAFTLIELLVVITIIVILLGLVGGVGTAVIKNQKVTVTKHILVTLDRALDEYTQVVGTIPPYNFRDYDQVPGPNNRIGDSQFFQIYGTSSDPFPRRPDAAVFLKQAQGTGEVQKVIAGIGERFLRVTATPTSNDVRHRDATPSVVDVWASEAWPNDDAGDPWAIDRQQVIYYVHPKNFLAQDLYGRCVNGRPYFLSAGPDLKYGLKRELPGTPTEKEVAALLADNVYSYEVAPFKQDGDSGTFFTTNR